MRGRSNYREPPFPWEGGSRAPEAIILSHCRPWVRGPRVAETTVVGRYHRGRVAAWPRARLGSHSHPWSAAMRVAEATIGKLLFSV